MFGLATPINRPLMIGEIVGALSTLDDGFYRGKILKKIDDATYLIHYIDFGDIDNVPISNIFGIPNDFMVIFNLININNVFNIIKFNAFYLFVRFLQL